MARSVSSALIQQCVCVRSEDGSEHYLEGAERTYLFAHIRAASRASEDSCSYSLETMCTQRGNSSTFARLRPRSKMRILGSGTPRLKRDLGYGCSGSHGQLGMVFSNCPNSSHVCTWTGNVKSVASLLDAPYFCNSGNISLVVLPSLAVFCLYLALPAIMWKKEVGGNAHCYESNVTNQLPGLDGSPLLVCPSPSFSCRYCIP